MALPRALPATLGVVAVVATAALLVVHIILAQSTSSLSMPTQVTATSIVASVFEACVLLVLCWLSFLYIHIGTKDPFEAHNLLWFSIIATFVTVAGVVSAVTVASLHNATSSLATGILGPEPMSLVIGSSVVLGVAFTTQTVFLIVHFFIVKIYGVACGSDVEAGGRRPIMAQVKSIPYSQTSPAPSRARGGSVSSRTPPGSSGGRSTTETMCSVRSSLSHAVRPTTSRTRLISSSQRSSRRPESLDLNAIKDRSSTNEDSFETWDLSVVDQHNRQISLQTTGSSIKGGHFLETIPASPTISRSSSPGTPLDLEPPRRPRRTRSFSPMSEHGRLSAGLTQHVNASESHIHPLFRSDSPTPPPIAKPGTVVTAAPNAGQIVAPSVQGIRRIRSGSLPQVPSPLSRQGSFEEFSRAMQRDSLREEDEEDEPEQAEGDKTSQPSSPESEDGKLTPPIPDWIMTAGARTSLYGYNSRRASSRRTQSRGKDEEEDMPTRQS
ncbi:uncharacterized protein PgNI_03837 [Pyricularia grisea]|uniref:Uncharacterized protein n=1 Tax=Pyricularia grisea TaxID=148305 RepID=A0A6P8BBE7_PYRGI|nr:uncharacterized protein PgNI_03837 [Pyricularia grisea]TLD13022.1 hypothetical protein PgNI_03837 [Pyricularia grisea]